jgi:hypothetical protein
LAQAPYFEVRRREQSNATHLLIFEMRVRRKKIRRITNLRDFFGDATGR